MVISVQIQVFVHYKAILILIIRTLKTITSQCCFTSTENKLLKFFKGPLHISVIKTVKNWSKWI